MRITISFIKIGLLITTTQFLLSSGCNKNSTKPCANAAYSFAVTCSYSPEMEVYDIGDTIFIESVFPKTLTSLLNPSTIVDYSNSTGIGGDIRINYLDTISRQAIPSRDSFDFVSIVGNFQERTGNQNGGINIMFLEEAQNYHFKGGIICKKKGIYGFGISDLASNGIRGKNCTNAGFAMTLTNVNKHLHLHQYALGVDPNDPMLQRIGYDFRVQ
jgi:hypothetical protein